MAIDKNTVAKEAQKYTAKGQYDKAIAEWKKLLKESPHDANLYNTIGDLCLKKNSKPEAVDAYRRAADILAQDGFTSKAIALYKKVLNIDGNQVEVHLALGDMNAEKGLTGNALENYKHVADFYTQQKEMVKALRVYQKMADLNPSNIAFRIKLADMYAKQGMNAEATRAYLDAADVHVSKDAFKDARQLFEKILAFDPNNKTVYYKAGILYLKEGKFNEACKALKPVFEQDPSNRELADTYVDALAKAGRGQDAEQMIKKILAEDPGRTDLRESLYAIYLEKKDFDRALEVISSLAAAGVERDDYEGAEAFLKKFVAACPHFSEGRQKLAEFYVTARKDEDAARTFLQVAEILSDEGDRDGAKTALDRALDIVPGMPEARELLEHLSTPVDESPASVRDEPALAEPASYAPEEAQGGSDAAQFSPAPATAFEAPAEVSTPEPVYEEPSAAATAPAAVEPPPQPEPAPAPFQEDPAIFEAFTEADVLVKYGLAMKAVEQLENLARKFPESPQVRVKLHDIYGDLGQMGKAAAHMLVLADLYAGRGMQDQATEVLRSAFSIDPNNAEIRARLGIAPQSAPPAETAPHEQTPAPTDMNVFEGLDADTPPWETDASVPQSPPTPRNAATAEFDYLLSDEEAAGNARVPAARQPQSHGQEEISEPAEEVELEPHSYVEETTLPVEEFVSGEEQPAPALASAEPMQAPAPEIDVNEIWAEAEFYYQQGLFNEAKKHYAKIIELDPDDKRVIARLSEISREEEDTKEFTRLADAVESLEDAIIPAEPAEKEMPLSMSDEEAVRTLMSEIAELKKPKKAAPTPPSKPMIEVEYIPPPPQPTQSWQRSAPVDEVEIEKAPSGAKEKFADIEYIPPAPRRKAEPPRQQPSPPAGRFANKPAPASPSAADEEDFFDLGEELEKESSTAGATASKGRSDDFFDLASELRDELSAIAVPSRPAAPAEEQSLDEIFEEFKRGVEQQTSKEDVDTHYNLGVAYKEMGLLDDAIEEFSLTPQGEPKFMHSRYLLGLCYMEKGEYGNAVREIDYALTYSEGMGEDEKSRIEMQYDLGLAHQGAGNISAATREFQKVQRANPRYRDVAAKLSELKKGDTISLDQLKGDIEKEISSKFLEEGERIEREEKNRRNVKVRH